MILPPTLVIALAVGGLFAPLGALTAGIITYREYSRHRLEPGRAIGEALRSAAFALLILIGCAGALGLASGRS